MTVKSTYRDENYYYFKLENDSIKSFPIYWVLMPWGEAQEHEELQQLLKQAVIQEEKCIYCGFINKTKFPYQGDFICNDCYIDLREINEIIQIWNECKEIKSYEEKKY